MEIETQVVPPQAQPNPPLTDLLRIRSPHAKHRIQTVGRHAIGITTHAGFFFGCRCGYQTPPYAEAYDALIRIDQHIRRLGE